MPITDKTIISVSALKQVQLTPNVVNNFQPKESFVASSLRAAENADLQAEARLGLVGSGVLEVTPSAIVSVPSESNAETATTTVAKTYTRQPSLLKASVK